MTSFGMESVRGYVHGGRGWACRGKQRSTRKPDSLLILVCPLSQVREKVLYHWAETKENKRQRKETTASLHEHVLWILCKVNPMKTSCFLFVSSQQQHLLKTCIVEVAVSMLKHQHATKHCEPASAHRQRRSLHYATGVSLSVGYSLDLTDVGREHLAALWTERECLQLLVDKHEVG